MSLKTEMIHAHLNVAKMAKIFVLNLPVCTLENKEALIE